MREGEEEGNSLREKKRKKSGRGGRIGGKENGKGEEG